MTSGQSLRWAIHSCITLGGAFLMAGLFPGFILVYLLNSAVRIGFVEQLLALMTTIMLIAPGVWYIVATYFMRRLEVWPIRVCYYVAGAQFFAVSTALITLFSGTFAVPVRAIRVPALLAIFFFPALFALLFELRRARIAILSMQPTGRAFQPVLDLSKASPNPANPPG